MPISNVSAYSYDANSMIPNTPFISIDLYNAKESDVSSACANYMIEAQNYADAHISITVNKDYVFNRLMYDLCEDALGITDGGIDKESNTISLHQKADELYSAAISNYNLNSPENISGIASAFDSFYKKYYLTDDETTCILDTDSSYYAEAVTYDDKAVTINSVGTIITGATVFINDLPNRAGTYNAQYTAYMTTSDANGFVNTPMYSVVYNNAYIVSEESSIAVWEMKDVSGESAVTVAYTSDAFDSNAVWTIVSEESSEEESSSESGEEIEEESSSSEE